MSEIAALAQTLYKVFDGQAGVPVHVAEPMLGMAYAIPAGTEQTAAQDYAPWTPAEVKQVFYRETALGAVSAEVQMILRWRWSASGQYIINAAFAVNAIYLDPSVNVSIDVSFDTPTPYNTEWEAFEIPFHVSILFDPLLGSSTTALDGVIRADGTGAFEAEA